MPPKKSRRGVKRGGNILKRMQDARPRYFVMPNGNKYASKQYGGNFQTGTGWFSDLTGKIRKGLEGAWNTGKKVFEVAKKINPSKYLDMVPHPLAQRASAGLKQVGLEGTRKRVVTHGNASVLLR